MEAEILKTLQDIKLLLYLVAFAFFAWVIFTGTAKASYVYRNFKARWEEEFGYVAGDLSNQGQYEKLKEHCLSKLQKYPDHAAAIYWLGKAYFRMRQYEEAKQQFEKLEIIAPDWASEYEPYMKRVNDLVRTDC